MSAHADYEDLLQWLACQDKKQIRKLFLVHGEYTQQQAMAAAIEERYGLEVAIPARGDSFNV